ncbi:hypothetical protein CIRMBP1307_00323 [Enterococcus cecorum]|nr:hypothetical protein CIRMBP1307_00323 [Enterococcus cecorum]
MTSLCFLVFSLIPYPIHGIHEKWVSFILQKGRMKMLLLKLIGYAFGILILVAIVCMIAAIIMAAFDESKHD